MEFRPSTNTTTGKEMQVVLKSGQQWPFVYFSTLNITIAFTQHMVCMPQSSALFKHFLESILFIATNCYNYVIQPSSFPLAHWQASFRYDSQKNLPRQDYNTVWLKSIRQSLKWTHQRKSTKMTITVYLNYFSSPSSPPSPLLFYISLSKISGRCGMLQKWGLFNMMFI